MCEAFQFKSNAFVTLTYNDETIPLRKLSDGRIAGTLVPRDLQLYLKKQRKRYDKETGEKMRFYGCGEYGGKTWRPHYHYAAFNFPVCQRGQTLQHRRTGRRLWAECCPVCRMVGDTWGFGDIEVRALDPGKCGYVAGYVTKKMTKKEDARLLGRHPEFSRQSRGGRAGQGGIGFSAVKKIGDIIELNIPRSQFLDIPSVLKFERKALLLGRYLKTKLREDLGITDKELERIRWENSVRAVQEHLETEKEAGARLTRKEAAKIRNAAYAEKLNYFEQQQTRSQKL